MSGARRAVIIESIEQGITLLNGCWRCRSVPNRSWVQLTALHLAPRLIVEHNEYGVWMTRKCLWANLDAPSLRHAMVLENCIQILGYFTANMEQALTVFDEGRKLNETQL